MTAIDTRVYEKGVKAANAEMKRLDIRGDAFGHCAETKFAAVIVARVLSSCRAW